MAEGDPADPPRTIPLNARIEPDLQAEIDRIAVEDARPGEFINRSRTARVLLWEAVKARRAAAHVA